MARPTGASLILDTSALIQILNPKRDARAERAAERFVELRGEGWRFYVPALAYHEAMRGAEYAAIRLKDKSEVRLLRQLVGLGGVRRLSISDRVLNRASSMWAELKARGQSVDNARLSGDVVIAAETRTLDRDHAKKTVLTENRTHLERLGLRCVSLADF